MLLPLVALINLRYCRMQSFNTWSTEYGEAEWKVAAVNLGESVRVEGESEGGSNSGLIVVWLRVRRVGGGR